MTIKNKQMKKEYLEQIRTKCSNNNMFHRCDKCGCANVTLGKWGDFWLCDNCARRMVYLGQFDDLLDNE